MPPAPERTSVNDDPRFQGANQTPQPEYGAQPPQPQYRSQTPQPEYGVQPPQPSYGSHPPLPSYDGQPWQPLTAPSATWQPAAPFGQPTQSFDRPKTRKGIPRWAIIAAGLAIVVVVALIVINEIANGKQVLTVKYRLIDITGVVTCEDGGSGGYDDIGPGMPVTVRDQDGKIIGSSSLPDTGEEIENHACEWTMPIEVEDAEQYAVEGGHRGAVTYSREQLEGKDWTVMMGVGG